MSLDRDAVLALQATIGNLIREELSNRLGEFSQSMQESLRKIVLVELPLTRMFDQGEPSRARQRSMGSDATKLASDVPKPFGMADGASSDMLHERTDSSSESNEIAELPGTVGEAEEKTQLLEANGQVMRGDTALTTWSAVPFKRELDVCETCNNVFKEDDSLFCQKCGAQRHLNGQDVCTCGIVFGDSATFCKKCGRERPTGVPRSKMSRMTKMIAQEALSHGGKHKKGVQYLFKQNGDVDDPTFLQRITTTKYYEFCSIALIIVNSFYIGWETQFLAERAQDHARWNQQIPEEPGGLVVFHVLFCLCFSVELGLRWAADGMVHFFETSDVGWNVLDVIIVSASILELLLDLIAQIAKWQKSDVLQKVSVLRMLRVVRIARVARAIRVSKFFRELRMMIYSIMGCAKNLGWVLIVLLMTFYIFGVFFTSAVTDSVDTLQRRQDPGNAELLLWFGTVDKSLLSLFMSMSGGNDWSQYYDALAQLGMPYTGAFLLFIGFTIFAVVNIVTGVFVEATTQSNLKDRDVIVHEELQEKKEYLQNMAELFEEMDDDGKGTISMQEFDDKLQDERVIAYFSSLKLDVSDARILFQLLDLNHSGELSIDEFLDGIYKLQGESRSLDMKIMQYEVRFLNTTIQEVRREIEMTQAWIKKKFGKSKNASIEKIPTLDDQPGPLL